jgi:RHS repeat-associated protein
MTNIVYDWRNVLTEIYFSDGKFIRYRYDASGKRIYKFVATPVPPPDGKGAGKGGEATGTTERTDYERGADGALVALYENANLLPSYYYHSTGYIDAGNNLRYYELRDQLGNIRTVVGETGNVVEQNDFYAYGAVRESGRSAGDGRWKFLGKELDAETQSTHLEAREYDGLVGRFLRVDPLSDRAPGWSPYRAFFCNPYLYTDPTGLFEDWVLDKDGNIRWDNDAVSKETTKKGEMYLGTKLSFVFNSFIDADVWDGPGGSGPAGDKLTTTVTVDGKKNAMGELENVQFSRKIEIGITPVGKARDFYPGLDKNQNKYSFNQEVTPSGLLSSFEMNVEQHASVSKSEEIGLNMMNYNIVNVAQRLKLNYAQGKLSLSAYTDIFPSASLTVNNHLLMYYIQPSFKETHSPKINGYLPTNFYQRK